MADQQDAAFIENIVKQLVEKPDEVKVERTVDEMGVLIQLTVDQSDMGRVIGKEGRTAKALRTLLRVVGAKNNARVNLKIMEPGGGEVAMGSDADLSAGRQEQPAESAEDKVDSGQTDQKDASTPAVEETTIEEMPADAQKTPEPQSTEEQKDDQAMGVL